MDRMSGRTGAQRVAEMMAAVAVDRAIGDPVRPTHPVRLMGRVITAYERTVRPRLRGPGDQRAAGAALALGLPVATFWTMERLMGGLPRGLGFPIRVWLLATTLGGRELARAAQRVGAALEESPQRAREEVGMIVGRETAAMTPGEVVGATIESVAENTSDGVVAPLLYGLAGGPSLALAYKAVSTLDSMVGYRNDRYQYFGWASARLDDVANLLPARVTATLALLLAGSRNNVCRSAWEDGRRHESPNAGLVEAAVLPSGATDVVSGACQEKGKSGSHARREEIGNIIQSRRRPPEVLVPVVPIADHRIQRGHRLVGKGKRRASGQPVQERSHDPVRCVLSHALDSRPHNLPGGHRGRFPADDHPDLLSGPLGRFLQSRPHPLRCPGQFASPQRRGEQPDSNGESEPAWEPAHQTLHCPESGDGKTQS